MNSFIRTIAVFIILNLTVTNLTIAQPVSPLPEPKQEKLLHPEPAHVEPAHPVVPHIDAAKIAAKETQEQSKLAQKQGELAAWQSLNIKLPKLLGEPPFGDAGTILVIPTDQMKAEDFSTIIQDMTVMSHIFNKNLQQAHLLTSSGFWGSDGRLGRFFGQDTHAIEAIFLDGYGAVFMVNVDFPLSPPPEEKKEEKETETQKPADPVWAETIKELYQQEDVDERKKERPEEKYDANKVENLKTTIIESLKHAANIRNLKPADSVIITVKGRDATGSSVFFEDYGAARSVNIIRSKAAGAGMGLSSSAVLIIRAKKSDVDEFAKDDIDIDKFSQRVKIFTQ